MLTVSLPINIPPVSASEQYFNLRGDASPKMVVGQISAKDPDHTRLYFYIIGATYFMNETASPISVKDETLDEDRVIENTCQKAELMLYPLNLFCIDLKGKILTSAKFPMNRPTNGSTFVLSILIQDSGIPPKNVTVKATLRMRLDQNDCNLQDVAQLYNQMQKSCDSRAFASLMLWNRFSHTPMKIVVNGNLYLLSMKIDFNKLEKWTFRIGEKVEYTLNFTNNSHLIKLNYTLLFNPTKENTQTVILPSAYLLRSLDTVEVTIRPESGNYLQGMHNAVVLYTVPNEEYCRKVSCIEMEANRIRILKKAKLDDCVSPDTKYFYFKYGRCLGKFTLY